MVTPQHAALSAGERVGRITLSQKLAAVNF
jgi:hypothetical protein